MSIISPSCYPMDASAMAAHQFNQLSQPVLPPPRSYYVVSWVPRALPEVVQLVKEVPTDAERCLINKHFELGMLVMRRCGVQNPEEIKCLLDGFREGTTRLSMKEHRHSEEKLADRAYNNGCSPAVERRKLLIFFNDHRASRPWVLCPAKHCIKSARTTGKVKGRVKILQFEPKRNCVNLPKLFYNCLGDFMTRDQYVFATFCPQQKYTDHELEWFDLKQAADRIEPGGDTIFRDLVEEHDTKGTRMWPFEDYIIFANSQSKIIAVFKKKQPLLTLYRHAAWPGLVDDATITTTASASPMMFGSFVGSNGMVASVATSCMMLPTTTSQHVVTTTSGGAGDFSKHGLDVEENGECCTVIDATTGTIEREHQGACSIEHPTHTQHSDQDRHYMSETDVLQHARPTRECRRSIPYATPTSLQRSDNETGEGTDDNDVNDDDSDSDFDLSESKQSNTGNGHDCIKRRRRRNRQLHCSQHHDDYSGCNPLLPKPIVSPAESQINRHHAMHPHHHHRHSSPATQMPPPSFEYHHPHTQFGFGSGIIPSVDLIRQAEEAENLLISIMTKVLGQLEPFEAPQNNIVMQSNNCSGTASSSSATEMKIEQHDDGHRCQPPAHECDTATDAPTTMTTTAGSSSIEAEDGQASPFLGENGGYARRKLDLTTLGQELDNKRRKVVHYPSPMNAVLYHQLVRQFLSRLAFGLDHPPVPQKRIPDTVKRVVTKIVADSIKDINLALLTSAIRSTSTDEGSTPRGQTSSVESVYSQPFGGFTSQAPPGNSAIVISSRAGVYSTFDERTSGDPAGVNPFLLHHHDSYGPPSMAGMAGPPAGMSMFPLSGGLDPSRFTGIIPQQHATHHHHHLHHQFDRNSLSIDSGTTMAAVAVAAAAAAAAQQQHQYILNNGGIMNTPAAAILQAEQTMHQHSHQIQLPYSNNVNAVSSGIAISGDDSDDGETTHQQVNTIEQDELAETIVKQSEGTEDGINSKLISERHTTTQGVENPQVNIPESQKTEEDQNIFENESSKGQKQTRRRKRSKPSDSVESNLTDIVITRSSRKRRY